MSKVVKLPEDFVELVAKGESESLMIELDSEAKYIFILDREFVSMAQCERVSGGLAKLIGKSRFILLRVSRPKETIRVFEVK